MDISTLKDQIWTTRLSRINAERRLIKKEKFVQGVNVYYSCVTIILSILSLVYSNNDLSLITTFMSICLLVTILYLNSERYLDHARDYRSNYTALHKLEIRLEKNNITPEEIETIGLEYCDLLDSGANHTTYDYYCTVFQSSGDYRKNRWQNTTKIGYYWGKTWRAIVMIVICAIPVVVYLLSGVI